MNGTQQQREFWRGQLSALVPPPQLPWDKERPPVSSFVRNQFTTRVEAPCWQQGKALGTSLGASPQVVLLTALNTLLFRYSGQADLIIGTLLSNNPQGPGSLVPLRTQMGANTTVQHLVQQIQKSVNQVRQHLGLPLAALAELAGVDASAHRTALFNVALIFSPNVDQNGHRAPAHLNDSGDDEFLADCPLVFHASEEQNSLNLVCDYDAELFEHGTIARLVGHFSALIAALTQPNLAVDRLAFLSAAEQQQLLVDWNATATEFPNDACIHQLFEAQVQRTPEAIAAICRDQQISYGELNARANRLAHYLQNLGVGPDVLVGICLERSLEMLVGLLGILKAGGAYLPVDPTYPAERIAFMLQDAGVQVLLTQQRLVSVLPATEARLVCLDTDWPAIAAESQANLASAATPVNLAYVIYTSGSTGKPKGVMIEHRNVINFFAGMDTRIRHNGDSTWLAVTSLSFDISVLELFWTLARGFKVVLFPGEVASRTGARTGTRANDRPMAFSLFYFSSEQTDGPGGAYRLLIEGAKFADRNGFAAVWTPERHFHDFGGLYPNPSVTSAALAMVTSRVQLRSGSVVAPLHSPIRIAEEWSVVDNLSNGRVAISFASGWMPEDFAVNPANYTNRKELMLQYLGVVRRLWRGESVPMPGPFGKAVAVRLFPRPVQRQLPLWLTAAGNPETFQLAGTLGINLLTHLLGQSLDEVASKVALYREAWQKAGHPGRGCVTLMLHTFVGDSVDSVKETVRGPLIEYLRKSADLIKGYAWAFSAFKHQAKTKEDIDFSTLSKEEMDAILAHAFERYFETSGLFGTAESCVPMIEKLKHNDIDEVACLIDFGVSAEIVLENLKNLNSLREAAARTGAVQSGQSTQEDRSIPELIQHHNVTHLQCTPSMASMLLLDEHAKDALPQLQCLLIGGEGFPPALAAHLRKLVRSDIINMYGPTETTVWSSTYQLPQSPSRVPVGRPIANTELYLLDAHLQPVPVGIAGELMIGGQGVARGYLNRPELTAERFIANPFNRNGSNRLYRTGDLARYLPDGNIELLGRLDHQVKIRGHRIELGEIETALNQHPLIRETVVVAREGSTGEKRLVAYVVPRADSRPTANEVRQFAKDRLPDYMVPAQVVFMDGFPQTPNKKIDRKALPAPADDASIPFSDFEPPITAVEQVVAGIWLELLGLPRVSRTDNFFDLGGNSLSATQLVARLREVFRVSLPLASAFEASTLAALASLVVANELQPGLAERTAKLLKQIEGMSDEAVQVSLEGQPDVVHAGA